MMLLYRHSSGYLVGRQVKCWQTIRQISFQLPEKYKGTMVEKWYMYWKNLIFDYREVGKETLIEIRNKPLKALTIFSALGFSVYCIKNNPDEQNFRHQVISYANDLSLVSESNRNECAVNYLQYLEKKFNAGVVRRLNLGLFSVIWYDNHDKLSGLYEAQCSYTKPAYLKFNERVLDIGFLNRWWIIDKEMQNYDVNEKEWMN